MDVATPHRKARPKPPATCRLTLRIAGQDYDAKPLDSPAGRGWRLHKVCSDDRYNVVPGEHGATCSCPDFGHRSGATVAGCKHVRACRAVGLID